MSEVAVPSHQRNPLAAPVIELNGVGRERAGLLEKLGIRTIEELLLHRPRRHEDRRGICSISQLQLGVPAMVRGKILAMGVKYFAKRTKSIFEFVLDDGTARLHCRWWNLPFLEKNFLQGDEVVVFGKMKSMKPRTMDHPDYEVVEGGEASGIHINRIVPVYPLTDGLAQRFLRTLIWRALLRHGAGVADPHPEAGLTDKTGLSRARALTMLHFPETESDVERARTRLALDELLELQVSIQRRRRNFERNSRPLPCGGDNRLIKPFLAGIGFKLTEAQTQVLREIRKDLAQPHPMRRLLQGDVGSGKTVVAACCALMVIQSGYDAALMAPTEILAEQHYKNFLKWFGPLRVPVRLHTGSHKMAEDSASPASPSLFIGTHALIEASFNPPNLGLVTIDEQHKFGVSQRERLVKKGRYPHLLVMTATPIPRTLGLTLYGDLDISTIDTLPPGRGSIRTFVRTLDKLPAVWEFLRSKLGEGRQAYIVYPRVEDTGGGNTKAVTREFEKAAHALLPYKAGLLHGRMSAEEKERAMAAFRANNIQALLSTSLIEVGVDVPNATIMLIENAEQFGMAQLHQLRGRIGRGTHDSHCILLASKSDPEIRKRLAVLEQTTDGFRIAEEDLRLRGPGELLGQEQSGMPDLKFADLGRDLELVKISRKLAGELLQPSTA